MRIDGSGMPVWSKSFIGTENDELTGVVAMPTGVAAFGSTETTDPEAVGFDDIWVVRTNVDGMVHFDPASGFETVNGAAQWSHTTDHMVRPIQPRGGRSNVHHGRHRLRRGTNRGARAPLT